MSDEKQAQPPLCARCGRPRRDDQDWVELSTFSGLTESRKIEKRDVFGGPVHSRCLTAHERSDIGIRSPFKPRRQKTFAERLLTPVPPFRWIKDMDPELYKRLLREHRAAVRALRKRIEGQLPPETR